MWRRRSPARRLPRRTPRRPNKKKKTASQANAKRPRFREEASRGTPRAAEKGEKRRRAIKNVGKGRLVSRACGFLSVAIKLARATAPSERTDGRKTTLPIPNALA